MRGCNKKKKKAKYIVIVFFAIIILGRIFLYLGRLNQKILEI